MISNTEDHELTKIQQRKIAEMLQRAQTPSKPNEKAPSKPILLTDSNFSSEIAKHKLIMVDFWAPWCGPCRAVSPLIEELAAEYAGKVSFGKLNVDENIVAAGNFGVQSIPTLIIFKNAEPIAAIVGACQKSYIESKFKAYLEQNQ